MSTLNQRLFWLLYFIITWLNNKEIIGICEFSVNLQEKENINIDAFLSKPGNKSAMNDWIQKYPTAEKAKTAFKRKVTGIHKKLSKKQKTLTGDSNWERLLEDAKTQQSYLINSSRVLRSSGTRVANELIETINVSNTN
jgi:hypothetical protein